MAITTWNSATPDLQSTTHKGLVLARYVREERVMSDIYANCEYALVWDPETLNTKEIRVRALFELDPRCSRIEIDANMWIHALWQARKARDVAQQKLNQYQQRVDQITADQEREFNSPVFGKTMVVTRSWKTVKRGVSGIVFWIRGNRIGLRTSDAKDSKGGWADVLWCQASQLANAQEFEPVLDDCHMAQLQLLLENLRKAEAHWEALRSKASV